MQWRDEGLVIATRRFGENNIILDVLTREHGRRSGLVFGGNSRRKRADLERGNSLEINWVGRLSEQLGRFDLAEVKTSRAARHLDDFAAMTAITVICEMLRQALDEGDDAGSALYPPTLYLLDSLFDPMIWPVLYVRWELGLLSALGFGLDLEKCALSDAETGLTHVSPNSGRAVVGAEAGEYRDRLLRLPAFLVESSQPATAEDIEDGLRLTGYFLRQRLFAHVHRDLPASRGGLSERLPRIISGNLSN